MITVLENTNLLDWFDAQTQPVSIIHQANCFCTMGSGIARQIRERYPAAYEADLKTIRGDKTKLGTFSVAKVQSTPPKFVYNLYGQFSMGLGRQTSYDAMATGLERISEDAGQSSTSKLGLPYNMGSALGGGDWTIVEAIIRSVLREFNVFICQYDPSKL